MPMQLSKVKRLRLKRLLMLLATKTFVSLWGQSDLKKPSKEKQLHTILVSDRIAFLTKKATWLYISSNDYIWCNKSIPFICRYVFFETFTSSPKIFKIFLILYHQSAIILNEVSQLESELDWATKDKEDWLLGW